ncbi:hypothetical protein E2C01_001164 [Portunus trituberculatus]|uniref:Uncharacterized protein n=1 Tax=Portunus trituberculatus TaxID=210409 RepID=A0A5B7CJR6_PORTR|nr:hypothetical protein [Portunus trituberculatus]
MQWTSEELNAERTEQPSAPGRESRSHKDSQHRTVPVITIPATSPPLLSFTFTFNFNFNFAFTFTFILILFIALLVLLCFLIFLLQ